MEVMLSVSTGDVNTYCEFYVQCQISMKQFIGIKFLATRSSDEIKNLEVYNRIKRRGGEHLLIFSFGLVQWHLLKLSSDLQCQCFL